MSFAQSHSTVHGVTASDYSLHLFLREYVETVYGVYEHVAWRSVVIAFHTSLGVNCTFHFFQLMEYVEGVGTQGEIAF